MASRVGSSGREEREEREEGGVRRGRKCVACDTALVE